MSDKGNYTELVQSSNDDDEASARSSSNGSFVMTEAMHYCSDFALMSQTLLDDPDDSLQLTMSMHTDQSEQILGRTLFSSSLPSVRKNESWEVGDRSNGSLDQQRYQHPQQLEDKTSGIDFRMERDIIEKVLIEIDKVATKRIQNGFNERNFTLGVLNMILVIVIFVSYPQHFWVLFLIEGIFFVTMKSITFWYYSPKPYNNILYLLDYCWVMNILAIVVMLVFVVDGLLQNPIGESLHKQILLVSLGTACGPLLGACFVLPFVCFLFHDVNTLADVFIHIFPPMVAYTFRWESESIRVNWPNIFFLDYAEKDVLFFPNTSMSSLTDSIVGGTIALYAIWFISYLIWMLTVGMDLPRRVSSMVTTTTTTATRSQKYRCYDTVFHSLMRSGIYIFTGATFFNRPKEVSRAHIKANDFERRDLLLYMSLHAVGSVLAIICLGYCCLCYSKHVHATILALVTVVCVYRGTQRYT